MTGPGSFSQGLTATQTLNNLAVGSYTIAAANVTSAGNTYAPTPTSQSKSVTAGSTATATVTYALVPATTGSLTVTSTGLPSGVQARISRITGPGGYSRRD